mmetsp:Transcript_33982/g.25069  ORF Transcript_33982/g.25069 Transcript_33982/m.25069 type:complete len:432 (-) Transcript_33982:2733-4028(-)
MNAPVRGSGTSETEIKATWDLLTLDAETGGSAILSYNLQWYNTGTSAWEDLIGYPSDYLDTSYTITSGLSSGTSYLFRVRASNIYGWSTVSAQGSITTSDVPDQMSAPTITELLLNAHIAWVAPDSNSDSITGYQILILKADGVTWLEDTTDCDGLSIPMGQLYCDVPMTTLVSTYGYSLGELVIAKVRATNSIGFGDFSEQNSDSNGAKVQTAPGTMTTPLLSTSTLTSISVYVADPTTTDSLTGRATIDSIHFQYKLSSDSTYTDIQGETANFMTLLTASASGLVAGSSYDFRVRLHNDYGWGTYSNVATFIASAEPDQPDDTLIVVSITNSYMRISWSAPSSNYQTIDAYYIEIQDHSATDFYEETTYCDGSSSGIVSQLYCDIPMLTTIRTSPYLLEVGDYLIVQIKAHNLIGWGPLSSPSSGGATL